MAIQVKELGGDRTAVIDPKREYVAGGYLSGYASPYGSGMRTLPPVFDDLTREHSPNIYQKMLHDPEISKCINVLKFSVLGDGVELLPSVPETDENYEEALKYARFCDKALKNLETPLRYTLEQLMDALVDGHKIAEITYKLSKVKGYDGQYLLPDKIKVKDRDLISFVIDDKRNVVGLVPNGNWTEAYNLNKAEAPKISYQNGDAVLGGKPILPREKFMVLTINGKNGDPRGQSILRPAFHCWHLKMQVWPEYLRYLLLCSIPLLVGFTPEQEQVKELMRDSEGLPIRDSEGRFLEANPVEALKDALLNARNSEVLSVKGGTKIQEIGAQGAGTPFFKVIELLDKQMEMGVLLQTLATSEGVHQSRAAAQTQMSVLDQLVWWLKGVVVDMLSTDLLRPLIRYNFGDDALELVPRATLGDTERREFATDSMAIAALYKAGYLQADQLKHTDAILGLTVRQTVDPLHLVQQLQSGGVPIVAVPPDPTHVAQVQAGSGGGSAAVPISRTGAVLPVSKAVDTAAPTSGGANVKFPAVGRVKSKINRSPANFLHLEEDEAED